MIVKQLNEHHLEFLSLKGGCIGLSTLVKMPHCWKSHAMAHMSLVLKSLNEMVLLSTHNICFG